MEERREEVGWCRLQLVDQVSSFSAEPELICHAVAAGHAAQDGTQLSASLPRPPAQRVSIENFNYVYEAVSTHCNDFHLLYD